MAMRQGCLDEMIVFAVAELASGDVVRINQLVRKMARTWETETALSICFALTSAASSLEDQFQNQEAYARRAYKLSSLLAADIYAIETMGQSPAQAHHLLQFWRRTDPYFLEL